MNTRKNIFYFTFLVSAILCLSTNAQIQLGGDISGQGTYDDCGFSVSMPDVNTMAVGSPRNDGSGQDAGNVRVYTFNGSSWIQKGADIQGNAMNDNFGHSVCMPDAYTVAIGAPFNDDNGSNAGQVRIYSFNGSSWVQKGQNLKGDSIDDWSGYSVSMPDANTVAIGAPFSDGHGAASGKVLVYVFDGSSWIQKGADINGEASGGGTGMSVSMPDANTIAIGEPRNLDNGLMAGQVRIFSWNGSLWVQKGIDLNGQQGDESGNSVSMPDANTVAIGAYANDENGFYAGQVRIYVWVGNSWVQKGININGQEGDESGYSVSMPDANTVAIGAPYYRGNGYYNSGRMRIYSWNESSWEQKGLDLIGHERDKLGHSVSMPDPNTVGIGSTYEYDLGSASVYSYITVDVQENDYGKALAVYPNPTCGDITVDMESMNDALVIVRDAVGNEVSKETFNALNKFECAIPGEAGIYFVEVISGSKRAMLKVIKQ